MGRILGVILLVFAVIGGYFILTAKAEMSANESLFIEKEKEIQVLLDKQKALGVEIDSLNVIKEPTLTQRIETVRKTCNTNKDLLDEILAAYQSNFEIIDQSDKKLVEEYEQKIAAVEEAVESEPYLTVCANLKQTLNIK